MAEEVRSYKGQLGGYRPGSGRKKGTAGIIMARSREYAMRRIEQEFGAILTASIDLAKGIKVITPQGTVYKKDPDVQALKHLMDQMIGKPKESVAVQHSGEIGLADLLGKGALDDHTDGE